MANNKEKRERADAKNKPLADEFVKSGCDTLWAFCKETKLDYYSLYKYIKRMRSDISLSRAMSGKSKASILAARNKSKRPDVDTLRDLYWNQGLTMVEVAKIYGVSSGSVCHWFEELGITARDYKERVEMWMDDAHKEHWRKLANDGKIGVHRWKDEWQGNKTTWIEAALEKWLKQNNIEFVREFQIEKGSHRYDFWLKGTKLLLETDGLYFHNRDAQQIKDRTQEAFAKDYGFSVLRFTDEEIHATNGKCFEVIKNEI
jgi:very-short-patch-repair endonuclease